MKNSIRFAFAGILATGLIQITASAQAPSLTGPSAPTSGLGAAPANYPTSTSSRAAVRNSMPSEAAGIKTPEPKRSTSSMQPNSGRPAEVNRATASKQPTGSVPTVKQPGGGIPEYPKPNATAPKSTTGNQPAGSTLPTVKSGTTSSKQPTGSLPSVKQPGGGDVPKYPQPNATAPKPTTSSKQPTGSLPTVVRPEGGAAIPTEYGAQQPPQPKLR